MVWRDRWWKRKDRWWKEETDNEEFVDIPHMLPLEDYVPTMATLEEVKEGKGLKILTPNKLLTRLPILLAEIKAGNNFYKLKKRN